MHLSMTLEIEGQVADRSVVLSGLVVSLASSAVGHTTAVFQLLQKSPWVSERLTILVISGSTAGIIFLRMSVGMVSSSQNLVFK